MSAGDPAPHTRSGRPRQRADKRTSTGPALTFGASARRGPARQPPAPEARQPPPPLRAGHPPEPVSRRSAPAGAQARGPRGWSSRPRETLRRPSAMRSQDTRSKGTSIGTRAHPAVKAGRHSTILRACRAKGKAPLVPSGRALGAWVRGKMPEGRPARVVKMVFRGICRGAGPGGARFEPLGRGVFLSPGLGYTKAHAGILFCV